MDTQQAQPATSGFWNAVHYYTVDVYELEGDPRVNHLPFMDHPWFITLICVTYLVIAKRIGPAIMDKREPYDVMKYMRWYNKLQIFANGTGFLIGCLLFNMGRDLTVCKPLNRERKDDFIYLYMTLGYLFIGSRLLDFVDTLFFLLRKRYRQITNFHVFHHTIVPFVCWFGLKFVPTGNLAVFPMVNSLIHFVMYTYYHLSTFESFKPHLWWKKHLTLMQLSQFPISMLIVLKPSLDPKCQDQKSFFNLFFALAAVFMYLFASLFWNEHIRKGPKRQRSELEAPSSSSSESSSPTMPIKNKCNGKSASASKQSIENKLKGE